MPIKTAWMYEPGEELSVEAYPALFPELDIKFFDRPQKVLDALGDEHKLFVLGLCAPPEPYSLEETKGGRYTGLRLIRDLRANPTSKDTPIIISTACSDMARDTLGLLEDEGIPTLSMPWERDDFMDALERVMPEIAALSH